MTKKDTLYHQPLNNINDFIFDGKVAQVFPDMIRRSVPGYDTIITMTETLAAQYAQPNTVLYDLGCSLGASTQSLVQGSRSVPCSIIAVDHSPAMLQHCQRSFIQGQSTVQFICADISDISVDNASLVVLNFTLQFVPRKNRYPLMQNIYHGLCRGGVLLLSEKICVEDQKEQDFNCDLHHAFKRVNGYSDIEISQKRMALENILVPETLTQHQQRLKQAGFTTIVVWFHCINFMSLIAIKP